MLYVYICVYIYTFTYVYILYGGFTNYQLSVYTKLFDQLGNDSCQFLQGKGCQCTNDGI